MTRGSLSSSHSQQASRANERKLPVREEVAHELPKCDFGFDTRVGAVLRRQRNPLAGESSGFLLREVEGGVQPVCVGTQ